MNKKKPTVVIVEDEPLLLEAIAKKLSLEDVNPLPFASGTKALQALEQSKEIPDVIWLDYQLQDMNGIEFMGKLKEKKALAQIPVVVVSNSAGEDNIHSMMTLGANEYYVKAENRLEDIIQKVKTLIKNYE